MNVNKEIKQLKIATWNLNCGMFYDSNGNMLTDYETLEHIEYKLKQINADVLALQELHFNSIDAKESSFLSNILNRLCYQHSTHGILSRSHRHENQWLGLSIYSKYPILQGERVIVPNPGIYFIRPDGIKITSHDKGFLTTIINFYDVEVVITNCHFFPYHSFGRSGTDPSFKQIWANISKNILGRTNGPAIVCGDFNMERLSEVLPTLLRHGLYRTLVEGPTRYNGMHHDDILITQHWSAADVSIIQTASDHHLCVVNFEFQGTSFNK